MSMAECLIIGGGIAGLQAAIQLGRSGCGTLVVDAGYGRSTLCRSYHNVLGWPEGVSGEELRRLGREHAIGAGVGFASDTAVKAEKKDGMFRLTGHSGRTYEGQLLLLATGVLDRFPELPHLKECLGQTVYVCPDCDGYEVRGKRTVILGAGNTGANMAITLHGTAGSLVFVNHEQTEISQELTRELQSRGIPVLAQPIREVLLRGEGEFAGVVLASGERVDGERGFIAFGGNKVMSGLAAMLGVERHENGHIWTDGRTKMTNVPHVWAAGDIGVHSEQLVIAMGEGMQAAIWMHKTLVELKNKAVLSGAT